MYLAEIELSVFLVGNTFYLNEGSVGAGVALCALVSKDAALAVESAIVGSVSDRCSFKRNTPVRGPSILDCIHPSSKTSIHGPYDSSIHEDADGRAH